MSKYETLVSPKGEFGFSHLLKPGKFGHLDIQLILEGEEAEKFQKFLADKGAEARNALIAAATTPKEAKAIGKMNLHSNGKPEEDQDGNETGRTVFTFKNKAEGVRKDGQPFTATVTIVDAKKKVLVGPRIGRGSVGKIAYQLVPFATSQAGVGVSLRLKAVQVLELVSYGASSADAFGAEEGYEAEDQDIPAQGNGAGAEDGDF